MTISTIQLGSVQLNVGDNTVTSYNKPKPARVVEHQVPGRTNNIYQVMGTDSRVFTITGRIKGSSKDTTKSTLEGYRGDTQTLSDGEFNATVIIESVEIAYDATKPSHYNYTIVCKEYSQSS